MMRHELLRILRNEKWKYSILILLVCVGVALSMNQDASFMMRGMFHVEKSDTLYMTSVLPVFLFNFLLYHIASKEEPQEAWKTLLPFPVPQRNRLIAKFCILFIIQVPIMMIGLIFFFVMSGTMDFKMVHYALAFQLIYLMSFMCYTFVVSSGYLSSAGSIHVVNVPKTVTPIFLLFCITNGRDWIYAFDLLWIFLIVCFLLSMLMLLIFHDSLIRRKLYREMILFKLFGKTTSQTQLLLESSKVTADKILQGIFKLLAKVISYRVIAIIEIGFKLHAFYVLTAFICFILWGNTSWVVFLLLAIVSVVYVLYNCVIDRNKIHAVRIRN